MKYFFRFLILIIVAVTAGFLWDATPSELPSRFAVVELFTSQGCSSCPAADALLSKIIREAARDGKDIFPLSFHVDYWNRLGWKDPFSQPSFSDRQKLYASKLKLNGVYTPQMVVNGTAEFVGSNEKELQYALRQAEKEKPVLEFRKAGLELKSGAVYVSYKLDGPLLGCKLSIALVSNREVTAIKKGENSGRTLTNEHVVRHFLTTYAKPEGRISFPASTDLSDRTDDYSVILFVQNVESWKILGATSVRF